MNSVQAFRELSRVRADRISFRACSENISFLQEKLIRLGTLNGHARLATDGSLVAFDKRGMEREISILNRFVSQLRYTSRLHHWINDRREQASIVLNKHFPADELRYDWQIASSPAERMEIINTVLNVHSDVYSTGAIPFRAPVLTLIPAHRALEKKIAGCVRAPYRELREGILPTVEISETILNGRDRASFREAFLTAHHEYVHWLLASLVAAMHTRELHGNHILYEDIEMENEKLRAGAIIDCAIKPAYFRQPEEKLCYQQEAHFGWEYLGIAPG